MKILYVCHRFPFPPKRGGKIRPFNMIRHFTAQGHQVTVCSLSRSPDEAKEGEGIAGHCQRFEIAPVKNPIQMLRMVVRLPVVTPSSMGFFYSPDLKRRIDALLASEKFDLIFVHCSSVAQYVEDVRGIPKILDFGDMDSQKWLEYANYKPFPLSLGYRLEGTKMELAEKRLAKKFDLSTATTRAEWETLKSYCTAPATDWFPNGVDAGFFKPDGEGYDADTLSFIGRMDYYPNQECMFDFCRNTLPLIQANGRRPSCSSSEPIRRRRSASSVSCPVSRSPAPFPMFDPTSSARRPWWPRSTSPAAPRTRSSKPWPWAFPSSPVRPVPAASMPQDGIHFLVGDIPLPTPRPACA